MPGRSLSLSVVLKTEEVCAPGPMLGLAAAVAVADVLHSIASIAAVLKWPNDVCVGDRKIAGILSESIPRHNGIVVGIGLNVNLSPGDLDTLGIADVATSISTEARRNFKLVEVETTLLAALEKTWDTLVAHGPDLILKRWSCVDALTSCRIELDAAGKSIRGFYTGLDSHGRLRLKTDDGTEHLFWSGDVRKVRVN